MKPLEALKAPVRRLRAGYRHLTGSLRGFPSALVIGAQRSGTTSLFNYVTQHPHILAPSAKEVHYFDIHYSRGVRWYRGRFPYSHRLRPPAISIDASPYYLLHPHAAERAAGLLPEVKLIVLLRNPVERAYSHYQHEVRGGRETLTFPEAIDREAERLAGEEERLEADPQYYSYNHHRYSYTRRGIYLDQLERWARFYPRSRMLILQSEWLFRDPAGASAAVYEFLGLEPHRLAHYKPFLRGKYEREIPAELRGRLQRYFEPHNRALFRWLGQEYDWT